MENIRKEELVKLEDWYYVEIFELNLGWERKVVSLWKENEEGMEKMFNEVREKEENMVNENVNLRNEFSKWEKI